MATAFANSLRGSRLKQARQLIQLLHLRSHFFGYHFVTMTIHSGIPAGDPVYIFIALLIIQMHAIGFNDRQHFTSSFMLSKRVPKVFLISSGQVWGVILLHIKGLVDMFP